ncbi:transmembrane protein, putative [Medicago truncatula]|uniref:Transmembrane protein, putative n=1 Tax=Medicago truncatula TaxID=3880 RepID=A0A072ULP6_MEDTR|nr:transmembrane protein, putative [Medicago truncatula]
MSKLPRAPYFHSPRVRLELAMAMIDVDVVSIVMFSCALFWIVEPLFDDVTDGCNLTVAAWMVQFLPSGTSDIHIDEAKPVQFSQLNSCEADYYCCPVT